MGTASWWHELYFTGPSPEEDAYDRLIELATDGLGFNFEGGFSTADANEDPQVVKLEKAQKRAAELEAALREIAAYEPQGMTTDANWVAVEQMATIAADALGTKGQSVDR